MSVALTLISIFNLIVGIIHTQMNGSLWTEDNYWSEEELHKTGYILLILSVIFFVLAIILNEWN